MRPVVFGPSPLMEAALGVFKGQELGRAREAEQVRAQREAEAADRRAQLDALTIAQRTIANEEATNASRQREAKRARVQADAARLRASPFNADGKYGDINDPADEEYDYAGALAKEQKKKITYDGLIATGKYTPEEAKEYTEADFNRQELLEKAEAAKRARQKHEADVRRIDAQTALDAARAAVERTSGGEVRNGAQETRDRARVAGWALATMRAGETDPQRLTSAALAMNPKMNPQTVAAAVADAQFKVEQAAKGDRGLPPLPNGSAPTATAGIAGGTDMPSAEQVLAWRDANPRKPGETPAQYKARAMKDFGHAP